MSEQVVDFLPKSFDNLRLCIEQLMKEILENSKPLEKQKDDFGKYLKTKGLPSEIRTQTLKTFDGFAWRTENIMMRMC